MLYDCGAQLTISYNKASPAVPGRVRCICVYLCASVVQLLLLFRVLRDFVV